MYSNDNGGLVLGANVDIQRTDGRVHSAIISHINNTTNSVTVEWFEKGEAKGKEIEKELIYEFNPNLRPKATNVVSTTNGNGEGKVSMGIEDINNSRLINKTKINGSLNSKVPINNRKARVHNQYQSSTKLALEKSLYEISCNSQKSNNENKFNNKDLYALSNGDGSGRNSVQSIQSTKTQVKGSKFCNKYQLIKEMERFKNKREDRRTQPIPPKDSMLFNNSDPNYEFLMMIREYQISFEYTNIPFYEYGGDHRISVCVRKRPLNKKETLRRDIDVISVPNKQMVIVHEPRLKVDLTKYLENQNFRFDFVFDDTSDNFTVYHYAARPLVESIFEKGMATCFAYGQTGSGKTHTMGGDFESSLFQDCSKGIYGLAAKDIFKLANTKYRKENLIVEASFFEIYGGKVFDLLNKKQKLRVLEDQYGMVQVVGLKEELVTSVDEVLKQIETGMHIRTSGQTSANQHSSRSHAVFQLILKKKLTRKLHGKFSLIDLAGNERGADTSTADRLTRMEGAEINKSLLALKECIRALGRKGSHLPFRASKLTQVLRDSFIGDNSRTCMIAMISPGMSCCEHTLNTLRYADRVKELELNKIGFKAESDDDNKIGKTTIKSISKDRISISEKSDRKSVFKPYNRCSSGDNKEIYNSSNFNDDTELSRDMMISQNTRLNNQNLLSEINFEHNLLIETLPKWLNEHKKLFSVTHYPNYNPEEYTNRLESLILKNIGRLSTLKVKMSKWNTGQHKSGDHNFDNQFSSSKNKTKTKH